MILLDAFWFIQVGVALLGGFGDLNVDRSSKEGEKAATATASTALTVQSGELLKLRVPELKKKLVEAGVDLRKYPGTVEKRVREERRES